MQRGQADPGIFWISVEELPPTEEEKRRDRRQTTIMDIVFYALIVGLTFYIVYPSGILSDPLYLGVYVAMLAGFGGLFYWRHGLRAARWGRNPYADRSRVGSTPVALYVEDFSGRREIPWVSTSTPELGVWRGRPFYLIPYRDSSGAASQLRLTAARMAATLRLPNRPQWNLSETFQQKLGDEFRARGVAIPAPVAGTSD